MDWVKIELGCEMPEHLETVIVSCSPNVNRLIKYICIATMYDDELIPGDEQIQFGQGSWQETPTHWARVELPNN